MPINSLDLRDKRVWVAGHRGMVGSAIVRRLASEQCAILVVGHQDLDLRRQSDVERWVGANRPDIIILAAAKVGGILANETYPADFMSDNLLIQTNVIEAAHQTGADKLLFLGSSCIYPKFASQPIEEDALLTGALEPTNQWYAVAKIAGIKLCQAYRIQHGRDFISAMPTNLYGFGDNFDLASSHVLPALLRKMHEAKISDSRTVTIWGSGTPFREFLNVDDLADACVFLVKNYSDSSHINVGSGEEVTILELAKIIANVVGYEGDIILDPSKPDGTPRKLMDSSKLKQLGWSPKISLRDGIRQTYDWYRAKLAGHSDLVRL